MVKKDFYDDLDAELRKLVELVNIFADDPTHHHTVEPQIRASVAHLCKLGRKIGGTVLQHCNNLTVDVNTFMQDPRDGNLGPKIQQDVQILQRDLKTF